MPQHEFHAQLPVQGCTQASNFSPQPGMYAPPPMPSHMNAPPPLPFHMRHLERNYAQPTMQVNPLAVQQQPRPDASVSQMELHAQDPLMVRPEPLPSGAGNPDFYTWDAVAWRWQCLLCNCYADDCHVLSKKHVHRATWPDTYLGNNGASAASTLTCAGMSSHGFPRDQQYQKPFDQKQTNCVVETLAKIKQSLPPQWEVCWSEDHERPYYYKIDAWNRTSQPTWERPLFALPPPVQTSSSSDEHHEEKATTNARTEENSDDSEDDTIWV